MRAWSLVLVIVGVGGLVGCSSDPSTTDDRAAGASSTSTAAPRPTSRPVPNDLVPTLARAYCEGMRGCCAPDYDEAQCIATASFELDGWLEPRFHDYSRYVPEKVAPCAAAIRARAARCAGETEGACTILAPRTVRAACDAIVVGTLPLGAECSSDSMCATEGCDQRWASKNGDVKTICVGDRRAEPACTAGASRYDVGPAGCGRLRAK